MTVKEFLESFGTFIAAITPISIAAAAGFWKLLNVRKEKGREGMAERPPIVAGQPVMDDGLIRELRKQLSFERRRAANAEWGVDFYREWIIRHHPEIDVPKVPPHSPYPDYDAGTK